MEVFRQIETHFARIDEKMALMSASLAFVREDLQSVRGCFASIEAMLIANAAQHKKHEDELARVNARLDALEKKAS